MLATLLLLCSWAFGYTADLCVKVDISYADLSFGDYWTTDVDKPARGFYWQLWYGGVPPSGIMVPQIESSGYLDDGAPTPGCTEVPLAVNGGLYFFRIHSLASVSGNYIYSYDNPNDANFAWQQESSFIASQDYVFDVVLPGTTEDQWNNLALATWALWRHDGGMNQTYSLFEADTTTNEQDGHVYLGGGGAVTKYRAAAEVGRLVSYYADVNSSNPGCNMGDPPLDGDGNCKGDNATGIGPLTKTYMAEAGCNGFAMFYAAMTWNDLGAGGGQNCEYRDEYSYDWDEDGDVDSDVIKLCHGDPYSDGDTAIADPDGSDWLYEVVVETDAGLDGECGGYLESRSTSYDWSTYFWDLVAQQGATIPQVWELWDRAAPGDWDVEAGLQQPNLAIEAAAAAMGISAEHDGAKDHGLDDTFH